MEKFRERESLELFLKDAYDLASGGIKTHLEAVRKLANDEVRSDDEALCLKTQYYNFYNNPYVFGWLGRSEYLNDGPKYLSPLSQSHLNLFRETERLNSSINHLENTETRNKDKLLIANIYKLGCMLAILEQVTYEAMAIGWPFRAEYLPPVSDYQASWMREYNQKLPTIGYFYQDIYSVVANFAPAYDNFLAHILLLPKPNNLMNYVKLDSNYS